MAEPIIPNPNPVTIPQKIYDQQYITRTIIEARPGQPWSVLISSVSYDGDVSMLNDPYQIFVKDIKGCAALVPEMALAMTKMIEALGVIAVACKATNTKQVTPENILATLAAAQGGQ